MVTPAMIMARTTAATTMIFHRVITITVFVAKISINKVFNSTCLAIITYSHIIRITIVLRRRRWFFGNG